MIQSGTAVWFARHEFAARLARLGGDDDRGQARAPHAGSPSAFLAFVIFMHVIAYYVVGGFAAAPRPTSRC